MLTKEIVATKVKLEMDEPRMIQKGKFIQNVAKLCSIKEIINNKIKFTLEGKPDELFDIDKIYEYSKDLKDGGEYFFFINNDDTFSVVKYDMEKERTIQRKRYKIAEVTKSFGVLYLLVNSKK